ncbi:MAG: D-alanyl-D-alanine carboxypeptidase family protein [Fimbriimonas sp.]
MRLLRYFGLICLIPAVLHAQAGPSIESKSAIAIDAESGRILWQLDADTPRYPASTTKVMTGLLLVERTRPEEIITAPDEIDKITGSSLHLKPGETLTAHDLLRAIMMRSANDGCVALAVHVADSVPAFVEMMNARARALGCRNTRFNNPNGLNDTLHTTSAHDLALIAREAMRYPEFREAVRTRKVQISRSINTKDTWMVNRNKWLAKDATADGIKTGWTVPSGHCYVGSATRKGFRVITVLLDSKNWQQDHKTLLDWSFANFAPKTVLRKGEVVHQAPIEGGVKASLPVTVSADVQTVISASDPSLSPSWNITKLSAPIQKGQVVGTVSIRNGEQELTADLLANESIEARPAPARSSISFLLGGAGMAAGLYYLKRKVRIFTLGN